MSIGSIGDKSSLFVLSALSFCLTNAYYPGKKHAQAIVRNSSSTGEVSVSVTFAYRRAADRSSPSGSPNDSAIDSSNIVFKRVYELSKNRQKDLFFVDGKQETYESYGFKLINYGVPFFGKERVPLILVGQSEVPYDAALQSSILSRIRKGDSIRTVVLSTL
jgi:hypothetical protein